MLVTELVEQERSLRMKGTTKPVLLQLIFP